MQLRGKYIKAKKVLKTIVQIIDSISNENQQNFWQDNILGPNLGTNDL